MSARDDLRQRMASVIDEYLRLDKALRQAEGHHFRVCIFGSARLQPEDTIYKCVYEVSSQLAQLGIDIVTGGGPGLMEAANRAVRDAQVKRVRSYGLPLDVPGIQEVANPHLDIKSMHQKFSSRLDEFMRLTHGVIVAPGGIGTVLELYYVWQLLQLAMVEPRPVVLLGKDFWEGLVRWMNETVLKERLISPVDMTYIRIVDTPEEAVEAILPAFESFKERRREEKAALKQARVATLQKVEEEVESAGPALEDADETGEIQEKVKEISGSAHATSAGNGAADPEGTMPASSKSPKRRKGLKPAGIVTPVDAANATIRPPAPPLIRRRRKRAARRL
ncbi:MAG: TIGR00730 family Rossman fold protein [Armatimonadetes bacterium]|nr:TIGR00730 family Rossman fold protein [Armatimonadota bacterium]